MTLLSVKELRIPYSKTGTLPLLSFELDHAALVFVTGSNGIGKSTFLKQLSGSIACREAIKINHKPLDAYSLKEKAQLIGFLEQQHAIAFPLLVKELVVMGRYRHKSTLEPYSEDDYDLVKRALNELAVDYLYEKNFLTLSGGEQQLCLLAQLSLQDPDIILLDEPTQNLDLYNKEKVFRWMNKQVREHHKTVICVTHDLHWIKHHEGFMITLNYSCSELKKLNEVLVSEIIEKLTKNTF